MHTSDIQRAVHVLQYMSYSDITSSIHTNATQKIWAQPSTATVQQSLARRCAWWVMSCLMRDGGDCPSRRLCPAHLPPEPPAPQPWMRTHFQQGHLRGQQIETIGLLRLGQPWERVPISGPPACQLVARPGAPARLALPPPASGQLTCWRCPRSP